MYDFRARSDAAAIINSEPSRTKQDMKAQCDINNILKKYMRNDVNPFQFPEGCKFGDYTNVPTYQDALNLIIQADSQFESLPAAVRTRFQNNPAQLLNFLSDKANLDEAVRLGLIDPKEALPPKVENPPVSGDSKA